MSHIGPDPRLPFAGKVFFWLFWIVGMALIAIFIAPLVYRYVSLPLGDWAYETIRQWTGEPPRAPRT